MTATPLRRGPGAPPPVRAVHLGLGSFFRAHQAWYTDRAAEPWGIAAFTGRRPDLATALTTQDGLYTLVTRGPDGDRFDVVRSVVRAHAAADSDAWLTLLADPAVRVLTTTVTEAGYHRRPAGGLDTDHPQVAADLAALRRDPRAPVGSVPARIVAGLLARRAADAGPLALVPCDNLPDNGAALSEVVLALAAAVDPTLPDWIGAQVTTATTMVDRITPEPTAADRDTVRAATGTEDLAPVVTEPFSEWVVSGRFPGGRPAWEDAGAVLTDDVAPFEQRKLWLLNGAHSLLAYVGSVRGHATVAEAVADHRCLALLHGWWDVCTPHLSVSPDEVAAYCAALVQRFANPRIRHSLAQIATDGSQKLPVRFLPVLRWERTAGRLPEPAVTVLAAWLLHLQGAGAPVKDVRADELRALAAGEPAEVAPRVLSALDPALADDQELVRAVRDRAAELSGRR
ncbi:mannitol dehydrogenase family protein [Modestobacter sp. VKM Ac-2984]|uniref:mannitol dehydrogenase family protein n=1 Tax=Modestobacter sp. VKM Ac-2984 TaxID=3004138 RepID=UPI0022AABAB1|nr:mannitol dehydrogenase family protein [Modestobacter sp. VKM Ac-2984]MCZ2816337.1 mannitol dehydrogenase family protein [Modestobacter sp. VKM Ac-2984]